MDLALNNLQRLICYKTQQTKPNNLIFSLTHTTPFVNGVIGSMTVIIIGNKLSKSSSNPD